VDFGSTDKHQYQKNQIDAITVNHCHRFEEFVISVTVVVWSIESISRGLLSNARSYRLYRHHNHFDGSYRSSTRGLIFLQFVIKMVHIVQE